MASIGLGNTCRRVATLCDDACIDPRTHVSWLQSTIALRLVGLDDLVNRGDRKRGYQVARSQIFLPLPIVLSNLWLQKANLPSRGEFDVISR